MRINLYDVVTIVFITDSLELKLAPWEAIMPFCTIYTKFQLLITEDLNKYIRHVYECIYVYIFKSVCAVKLIGEGHLTNL